MIGPGWLWHPLGNCPGTYAEHIRCLSYNAWSGSFSDLGEITLVASALSLLILVWHHLNCGAPGCYRIGKHHYTDKDGKRHSLCHVHDIDDHPKGPHWWSRRRGHSLEAIHERIRAPL